MGFGRFSFDFGFDNVCGFEGLFFYWVSGYFRLISGSGMFLFLGFSETRVGCVYGFEGLFFRWVLGCVGGERVSFKGCFFLGVF